MRGVASLRSDGAPRSQRGSDCAGLVTFHPLSERLTRLELQLDVVPSRLTEAAALALHLADHRAETELRIFKARLETISPDEYEDELGEEPEPDEGDQEPERDEGDQEEE